MTRTGPPCAWAMSSRPNPTTATALDAKSGSIVRIILVRSPIRYTAAITAPSTTVMETSCQFACMLGENPTAKSTTPMNRIHQVYGGRLVSSLSMAATAWAADSSPAEICASKILNSETRSRRSRDGWACRTPVR